MSNNFSSHFIELLNFFREKEAEQKKRYYGAIDIDDMDEATAVTLDARVKIQQLRKWIDDLERISGEIEVSFLANSASLPMQDVEVKEKSVLPEPENTKKQRSIENIEVSKNGEYVKQKMYQLSKRGFVFTEEQLRNMQDCEWSKKVLKLSYSFIRIYDKAKSIAEQTSINGNSEAPKCYWMNDRFQFGKVELLICNGWTSDHIPFFDTWYESLERDSHALKYVEKMLEKQGGTEKKRLDKGTVTDDEAEDTQSSSVPINFELFGKRYHAENWKDIFIKLCEAMILKKPYKMANLGIREQYMLSGNSILSLDENQLETSKKLSNGFYVAINGTPEDLRQRCEYILSECGFDSNVLQIR